MYFCYVIHRVGSSFEQFSLSFSVWPFHLDNRAHKFKALCYEDGYSTWKNVICVLVVVKQSPFPLVTPQSNRDWNSIQLECLLAELALREIMPVKLAVIGNISE